MKFNALHHRVQRAELLLEGRQQQTLAHWNQLKTAWRAGWTPWRIVSTGLVAGFVTGRAEPLSSLNGQRALRMVSTVANLFAGVQAAVGGFADVKVAGKVASESPEG
jgi:hypothetical protein